MCENIWWASKQDFRPPTESFLPGCHVSAGAYLTNKSEKFIIKTIIVIRNL